MIKKEIFAIVTGCASGIGNEIANRLVSKGIEVIGLDIEECTCDFPSYVCDVSDERQVQQILALISKRTQCIDYLINAAGILCIGKALLLKEMSVKQWDAILKINLGSVMVMSKNVYPYMLHSDRGAIVNISSEQVYNPDLGYSSYAVSKSAINMLTICTAKEFLKDKIRVNAIALGTVKTNILKYLDVSEEQKELMFKNKKEQIPFGLMSRSDVADIIEFLISDHARFITGEIIRCDGGKYLRDNP